MATNFVVGQTYTNVGAGVYADDKAHLATNVAASNEPAESYVCTRESRVHVTFKTATGVLVKLRKYRDTNGKFVYTHRRFAGAPILRP